MSYIYGPAILKAVDTHVVPPIAFLEVLIDTIKSMPDSDFAPNEVFDVYSSVEEVLLPTTDPITRKAQMCEILRALAAFESDYNWNEGADTTAGKETPEEEETGCFQVSANSMNFTGLREFAKAIGIVTTQQFITQMKLKHSFAVEYIVKLLRITVKANGPVLHKAINGWITPEAVNEFKSCLIQ